MKAVMSQERKRKLVDNLKRIMKPYNCKFSLRVQDKSTIVLTIREGAIDFLNLYAMKDYRYIHVNPRNYRHRFQSPAREVLTKIFGTLNSRSWLVEVNVSDFHRPYEYKPIG